jgi:hypothetical protein
VREESVQIPSISPDKQAEAFQRIVPLFAAYRRALHADIEAESEQTDLSDLMADLMHFCDLRGLNIVSASDAGQRSYMGEKAEQDGGDFSDATGLNDPDLGPLANGLVAAQDLWLEGMAKSPGSQDFRAAMEIAHVALGYRAGRSGYTQRQYVEFYAGFVKRWENLREIKRAQR